MAVVLGEIGDGLVAAGVAEPLAARLADYGERLLTANRTVNLTGAKGAAALLPHLLDALTLLPDIREMALSTAADGRTMLTLADIGSGGGLPGIPLALAVPGLRVLLVEPIRKKAAFLAAALSGLGIEGDVAAERAETAARDPRYRERFDLATARGVGRAPTVAELATPFVRVGGRVLLQRGAMDSAERQALEDAAPILGAEVAGERLLGGDLRVVVLLKRRPVGERFPRRNGVPEKRPLCLS